MADDMTPTEAYGTLDQAQRAQLAQDCASRLRAEDDPECRAFAQMNPSAVTPEQMSAFHEHLAHNHPAVLEAILRHPIITGTLTAFAVSQLNKYLHKA
jgi:hypothetical protein